MQAHTGYILEVEPAGLNDCSDVGCRAGGIQGEAMVGERKGSRVTHRFES